ncbi:2-methylaconitate cis-trans isomerase PrpF family protein [Bradyrhizobium liaoningense]|uniref:2-methylaconitate cis-trans isomerase PrpF family protein n=1 Tax=Bradyrhizobium liaoningense TaxID=43992 RepID=UPI001BA89265|nr:PrpF domain-containing protein [Bradyrhizobium liaoningense]MBR0906546.1 PrpF family protein [Bradyrhizobium liaoningense]
MPQNKLRATFMRGGTSKAVVFNREDLPADPALWDAIFLSVMGSPDPNGRQLDGMGGGLSSLSKVCVVGAPTRSDADIDYTFAQISVKSAAVDYSANCGNMSSAMGPFAVSEGLVTAPANGEAVVRIHNTNTGKIIVARFPMNDGEVETEGEMSIDGVGGQGAPVRLEFTDPGGTRTGRLLPTGHVSDTLDIPDLGPVEASLVDAANPCVFVAAAALGKDGSEMPEALESDAAFLERMEAIRCAASVAMDLAPDVAAAAKIPSVPKVAMIVAPRQMTTLSGQRLEPSDMSLGIRMISIGQPHRAIPITGATCLAIAVRIKGTLANRLARVGDGPITIAHPSGTTVVDAAVEHADDPAKARAIHGAVYRTARRLFEGSVFYRPAKATAQARRSA